MYAINNDDTDQDTDGMEILTMAEVKDKPLTQELQSKHRYVAYVVHTLCSHVQCCTLMHAANNL